MNQWFEHLTDRISVVRDTQAASTELEILTHEAGFDAFAYVIVHAATHKVISNYAAEYQTLYKHKSYFSVDPVLKGLRSRTEAFEWSYADTTNSKKERRLFNDAATYGIRAGIAVPIRGPFGSAAVLALATSDASLIATKKIDPVIAASAVAQIHSYLDNLCNDTKLNVDTDLKPNQLLCLSWNAEGKTAEDIAVILGTTYGNVRFHLREAKHALGATTLTQAARIATALRIF
ncbi:autoinducer binding domain-containing protein [Neorhizobium sp. BT27B]|uniref:autoinducer binding domain-containing protein n=1 Tax=Neorhizobium sp. BT27B TaxID=3142625 RepID=UPI003D2E7DEA